MRVCGIDPGTRVVGVGVVEAGRPPRLIAAEAITLDPRRSLPERLRDLEAALLQFLVEQKPDAVAIERIFQGRNVASLIGLGEGRGVAILAAAKLGVVIAEYTPAEVKKGITGNGAARKDQVAKWVRAVLPGVAEGVGRDVTDALAIALCHIEREPMRLLEAEAAGDPAKHALLKGLRSRGRRARRGRSR